MRMHGCGPRGRAAGPMAAMIMTGFGGWGRNWGSDWGDAFAGGGGRGPRGGPGRRGPGGRGRMFGSGELRLVVLGLIAEAPRHGYELIKGIEQLSGGQYAPSPGVVYPTLQLLEDLGYARVVPSEGGKKVFEITDEGKAHLAANQDTVDSIFDRIGKLMGHFLDEPMTDVHRAFQRVGKATYSRATDGVESPLLLRQIVEVLERATTEIEALSR